MLTQQIQTTMKEFKMNSESEMSSFLPTNVNRKKEKDIIDENFLDHTIKHNWNVGSEPLNEFSIQYLTSMSFPTLFPDGITLRKTSWS